MSLEVTRRSAAHLRVVVRSHDMKQLLSTFLLLASSCCLADEFSTKLDSLNSEFESLLAQASAIDDPELRDQHFEKLREYASVWYPFSFLYSVNGSDELQEVLTEEILVSAVYGPFTAEQAHYNRCIIHTDGHDDRARELMGQRAEPICRLYPIGRRATIDEDIYFAQLVLRIHMHAPKAVSAALKNNLPRWHGEERIIALLVLAHEGSEEAKAELEGFDSERFRKLSTLTQVTLKHSMLKTEHNPPVGRGEAPRR